MVGGSKQPHPTIGDSTQSDLTVEESSRMLSRRRTQCELRAPLRDLPAQHRGAHAVGLDLGRATALAVALPLAHLRSVHLRTHARTRREGMCDGAMRHLNSACGTHVAHAAHAQRHAVHTLMLASSAISSASSVRAAHATSAASHSRDDASAATARSKSDAVTATSAPEAVATRPPQRLVVAARLRPSPPASPPPPLPPPPPTSGPVDRSGPAAAAALPTPPASSLAPSRATTPSLPSMPTSAAARSACSRGMKRATTSRTGCMCSPSLSSELVWCDETAAAIIRCWSATCRTHAQPQRKSRVNGSVGASLALGSMARLEPAWS